MFRIDGPGAGPGNTFTEGDPQTATPATVVTAAWAQAVQDELCNTVEAAGIVLDKNDSTQLLQSIRALGSGGGSNPAGVGANMVVNGDMRIFQDARTAPGGILTRALGVAITAYTLDQWESSSDGGGGAGNASVSRQLFTEGQVAVPGFPTNFLRHQQTVAATVAAPFARTKLDVVSSIGGTVTLSFWIKAAAGASVTARVVQGFGSGGSADVIAGSAVIAVTTSWQRGRLTVALPSVSGKTFGADNHLRLELLFPTGATFTIDLADVQLEQSPTPTSFQRRALAIEQELARRFFEKSWSPETAAATCPASFDGASCGIAVGAGGVFPEVTRRFQTPKRKTPTVTFYAPSTQVAGRFDFDGVDRTVTTVNDASLTSTGYPSASGGSSTKQYAAHWTADARI